MSSLVHSIAGYDACPKERQEVSESHQSLDAWEEILREKCMGEFLFDVMHHILLLKNYSTFNLQVFFISDLSTTTQICEALHIFIPGAENPVL